MPNKAEYVLKRCAGALDDMDGFEGVPELDGIGHERGRDMQFLGILESREDVTTSLVSSVMKSRDVLLIRRHSPRAVDNAPGALGLKQSLHVGTPGSPVGLPELRESDFGEGRIQHSDERCAGQWICQERSVGIF